MVSQTKKSRQSKKTLGWRSFLNNLLLSVTLILVAIFAIFVQRNINHILPISQVSISGNFQYVNKQGFNRAIRGVTQGSILNIDVVAIQDAGEALPWVAHVQVKKVWPDSLHLLVTEQVAVARWGEDSLINVDGDIFTPSKETLLTDLPMLAGTEDNHRLVIKQYLRLTSKLQGEDLAISRLVIDDRRAWNMTLDNGIKVVFGRLDSERRFARFIKVYQHVLKTYQHQISAVDMRYPNGVSVVWKQEKPNFNRMVL